MSQDTENKMFENKTILDKIKENWIALTAVLGVVLIIIAIVVFNNASSGYTFEPSLIRDYNPQYGKKDSSVKFIYLFDFQCPACAASDPVTRELKETYQDRVHFVYRNFPLSSIHPYAVITAEAGNAVYKQSPEKYMEFKQKIFAGQTELSPRYIEDTVRGLGIDFERWNKEKSSPEIKKEVDFDMRDVNNMSQVLPKNGDNNKPTGTPTLILKKGDKVVEWSTGGIVKETIAQKLDIYLAQP
jgi:protein-disulfide isomerase